jgi:hypothetical protein
MMISLANLALARQPLSVRDDAKVRFDVDTSLPAVKLKKLRQFGVPLRAEI